MNCCFQIRQVRRLSSPCIQRYSLFCSGECGTYVSPALRRSLTPAHPTPSFCPHPPHQPPPPPHSPNPDCFGKASVVSDVQRCIRRVATVNSARPEVQRIVCGNVCDSNSKLSTRRLRVITLSPSLVQLPFHPSGTFPRPPYSSWGGWVGGGDTFEAGRR